MIIFGDSNVVNHSTTFTTKLTTKVVPTFTFSDLMQNIQKISGNRVILVHVLTNDIRLIAKKFKDSDNFEVKRLAKDFSKSILDLSQKSKLYVSAILPFKNPIANNMRKYLNSEISRLLSGQKNIEILYNDAVIDVSMLNSDGFHLSDRAVSIMLEYWLKTLKGMHYIILF